MAYYSSPEEMFAKRAENYESEGNRHWAMAKTARVITTMVRRELATIKPRKTGQKQTPQGQQAQPGAKRSDPQIY